MNGNTERNADFRAKKQPYPVKVTSQQYPN